MLRLVAAGPAGRHARVVVVRAEPHRLAALGELLHDGLDDRAQLVDLELGAQEREVLREVEVRVVVEEPLERNVGLAHEGRLRDVLAGDLLPAAVDLVHLRAVAHVALAVAELAVFDQAVRDVDAEAAHAAVEPEAEDVVELITDGGVPPVEVGLLGRELVQVVLPPRAVVLPGGVAGEDRPPVVRDVLRPDVVLGPVAEPRVLVGGVVRDEVEPDLDVSHARVGDQRVEVVERAVVGVDGAVVGDVVAPVDVRRRVHRAQPEDIDTELC